MSSTKIMSNRNLVVLAMSTLPIAKTGEIGISTCIFDGQEFQYRGQLEPISTMIRDKEGHLDKIIILATKETLEPKNVNNFPSVGDKLYISAVDFYKRQMNLSDDQIEIVNVEENDFIPAISTTVKLIRDYKEEVEKDNQKMKLWLDTQGSFRNINLVLNAVISLLYMDDIVPSGVYSMNYNQNTRKSKIIDQTKTYKIFRFVSGINEFVASGRANQLKEYYEDLYGQEQAPEFIESMKKIAESIQMCNMDMFDKELKKLRKHRNDLSSDDILLNLFMTQIQRDYGKLLEDDCLGLDIVEWFYKKGFYQQAITFIESKLPQEWVQHEKIIRYEKNDKCLDALSRIKNHLKKKYERNENILIATLARTYVNDLSISDFVSKKEKSNDLMRIILNSNNRLIKDTNNRIELYVSQAHARLYFKFHRCNDDNILLMLFYYNILKRERNNFNHMSTKERAGQKELGQVIGEFLEVSRKVYSDKKC